MHAGESKKRWKIQALKWFFAVAFVTALFLASWNFFEAAYSSLTPLVVEPDRSKELPALPLTQAVAKLQIALGENPSSTLWLICAAGPQVRLALRTRLPGQFDENRTRFDLRADFSVLENGERTIEMIRSAPHIIFEKTVWRRDKLEDVVLMPPLSANDINVLSKAFLLKPAAVVRIDVYETGTEMRGVVDGATIKNFIDRCLMLSP